MSLLSTVVKLLLLLMCSKDVVSVTLPVALMSSYPKHLLTVEDQKSTYRYNTIKSLDTFSAKPGQHQEDVHEDVHEDEVIHHIYENSRLGADYHLKASTVFMMHLFNDMLRGLNPVKYVHSTFDNENFSKESVIPYTDTIRSFSATEVKISKHRKTVVNFFIPFLPREERLRLAEIRFLRNTSNKWKQISKQYTLRIDVLRNKSMEERVLIRERIVEQPNYDVFDLSRVLLSWINTHHGNISIRVHMPRVFEKWISPFDTSMKSTSLVALYLEDREFLRNVYQSYTTPHNSKSSIIVNNVHDVSKTLKRRNKRNLMSKKEFILQTNKRRKIKHTKWWYFSRKRESCKLYDSKVDFDLIGWGQWIIHPKQFNAKFCYGHCPSPVDVKYKPTNHAMLQSLMRQKKKRLAPPTCCVPIRLKPISMLYFEYDEIVVRHHDNMIADECGCK